jgi:hypothetical protein
MFCILIGCIAALVATRGIEPPTALALEHADAFIVCPRATRIWSRNVEGWSQLTYHVEETFPASSVIGYISYKLQKQGWQPQTHDFLNLELQTSQVRGWGEILEGPRIPGDCVHRWIGDWKDRSGNIVRYTFRYREGKRRCTSNPVDLEVNVTYVPVSAAERLP